MSVDAPALAPERITALLADLRAAREAIRGWTEAETAARVAVLAWMDEQHADGVTDASGTLLASASYTVVHRLDSKALKADHPDLVARYTTETPQVRLNLAKPNGSTP